MLTLFYNNQKLKINQTLSLIKRDQIELLPAKKLVETTLAHVEVVENIKIVVHDYKVYKWKEQLPIQPDYWCRKFEISNPEENNWINYMDCKDLLFQLLEAKFIYKPNTTNNESRYNITVAGRECLSQFFTKIPASMRNVISKFAVENKLHFKRNQEYIGNYYKSIDGSYTVELRILEPLTTDSIFSVSIKTDTRHNAIVACKKWRELAPNIYEQVYSKIIEE